MRTTLDLPDPIFRQLKAESALRGLKLKELIAEFIQAGLQRSHETAVPRLRSPLPVIRKRSGATHASLSSREIDSLLTSDDADGQP